MIRNVGVENDSELNDAKCWIDASVFEEVGGNLLFLFALRLLILLGVSESAAPPSDLV